jgi:hypothetical protein
MLDAPLRLAPSHLRCLFSTLTNPDLGFCPSFDAAQRLADFRLCMSRRTLFLRSIRIFIFGSNASELFGWVVKLAERTRLLSPDEQNALSYPILIYALDWKTVVISESRRPSESLCQVYSRIKFWDATLLKFEKQPKFPQVQILSRGGLGYLPISLWRFESLIWWFESLADGDANPYYIAPSKRMLNTLIKVQRLDIPRPLWTFPTL